MKRLEEIPRLSDGLARLERLRTRRLAEDERLVCLERARILDAARRQYAALPRVARQAAVLRALCEQITPVIEPEDILVGRMPEAIPSEDEERWIQEAPELFIAPGLPGCLDSMSIYIPDWEWLLQEGPGGIAAHARRLASRLGPGEDGAPRREFLEAAEAALHAVSTLVVRYAEEASRQAAAAATPERRRELEAIAARCRRIAWEPPVGFLDALQLLQIVHMVLACLVGGRDVTPGRLDQYLLPFYERDVARGALRENEAAVLLAMFLLRLSQMGGNGTDFDDNLRRTPCQYTHLYVTVGGVDKQGRSALNPLSSVVLEAVRLLRYKEPTLLVRYHEGMDRDFLLRVAGLVRERLPVTVYHDEKVIQALVTQGVPLSQARGYAHSACHNVVVVGHEAGTGVGGFHNLPRLLLRAVESGGGAAAPITTFAQLLERLREEVRAHLAGARTAWERAWHEQFADACPLLQSCLLRESLARCRPCWQAASISHFNHYLMGLGTTVDSLLAIRQIVFEEGALDLDQLRAVLERNWEGHEPLRQRVRTRLPRYGQGGPQARELAATLGQMWVAEVERASRGMDRFRMWPGFYSHMEHAREGARTPATPDGRRAGDPLSENVGPSFGTPGCSPTSILEAMSALPFDHTPSGAATLTLNAADLSDERLVALVEGYFHMGGLHLQINVLDVATLEAALQEPEAHSSLMVRVTGFSAYFTRLSRSVQEDLVRRARRDRAGAKA